MIKKLQLRGISRTPSDRMTSDGGCAESLNVQLHAGEIAPMPKPEDATSRFERITDGVVEYDDKVRGEILYIHKGNGYENLITVGQFRIPEHQDYSYEEAVISYSAENGGQVVFLLSSTYGYDVKGVASVGNTLVVSMENCIVYALYKDGRYIVLGDKIPVPEIEVTMQRISPRVEDDATAPHRIRLTREPKLDGNVEPTDLEIPMYGVPGAEDLELEEIERFSGGTKANGYKVENPISLMVLSRVGAFMDEKRNEYGSDGRLIFPVFVRYAARLYDGSVYGQSVPILVGADTKEFASILGWRGFDNRAIPGGQDGDVYGDYLYVNVSLPTPYAVSIRRASEIPAGWEDIITSVDIFVSPQFDPFPQSSNAQITWENIYPTRRGTERPYVEYRAKCAIVLDPTNSVDKKENLLKASEQTWLGKRFTVEEFNQLDEHGYTELDDIDFSSDYLLTQEVLKESTRPHQIAAEHFTTFNERLLATGVKTFLARGREFYDSGNPVEMPSDMRLLYGYVKYILPSGIRTYSVLSPRRIPTQGTLADFFIMATDEGVSIFDHGDDAYYMRHGPWLAYPDARCNRAEVYLALSDGSYRYRAFAMKPFGTQDVAFAFIGFGNGFGGAQNDYEGFDVISGDRFNEAVGSEERAISEPNVFYQSEAKNPFVFPTTGHYTMPGNILNVATVTHPLSEGQFGQFPLYVFTDEGVFVLSTASDGVFASSHPVSRDILISRDALTGIEQGVFFAAARGLLLLRGSTVTKVSDAIEGPTITMDSDLMANISEKHFGGMVLEPQQPFHEFLSGCRIAYDYASTRIILMNEAHRTMYVYKFDTQTWHRMDMGLGYPVRALNSFPEAFIVTRAQGEDGTQAVYNFSVVLESAHAEVAPGLIITRPFDLGEPDVRKAVRDLRVRGNFHRHDVAYILFGSFDGIHWVRLRSLHGGSFKQFRMMILTGLSPTERISWVDVDYDTRFTNKLR